MNIKKMQPQITRSLAYTLYYLLVLVPLIIEGNNNDINPKVAPLNGTANSTSSSSPWLRRVTNPRAQQARGCWNRPWVCAAGQIPPRRLCCMNRCVDIMADPMNCGFCGVRCPFTWQCCGGVCVNVNLSPFHCGRCWNRCQLARPCSFGLCGYAQSFPLPPGLPGPPFPFPPGLPGGPGLSQRTKQSTLQKY